MNIKTFILSGVPMRVVTTNTVVTNNLDRHKCPDLRCGLISGVKFWIRVYFWTCQSVQGWPHFRGLKYRSSTVLEQMVKFVA